MLIMANSGHIAYGIQSILIDTEDELKTVDTTSLSPGSDILVLSTSKRYILNTKKEWVVLQTYGGDGSIPPGSEIIYDGGSAKG